MKKYRRTIKLEYRKPAHRFSAEKFCDPVSEVCCFVALCEHAIPFSRTVNVIVVSMTRTDTFYRAPIINRDAICYGVCKPA